MESLPLGHYLKLVRPDGSELRFQNFHIGQTSQGYLFLPFGFSGMTVARDGGNVDATLGFPNNEVARSWADEAIQNDWIAIVEVCIVNLIDYPEYPATQLYQYVGQVAGGGWSDTLVTLKLNTVLDAVGNDIPKRTLHQALVGFLPVTSNIAL
jgi:hypothetical protein